MMQFSQPLWFLLAVPLVVLSILLLAVNRRALAWLKENVSRRFMDRFTGYGPRSLVLHMVFLFGMGLLLIAAAAGPYRRGMVERSIKEGNVILLLDASFSMEVKDIHPYRDNQKDLSRFEQAKLFAQDLIELLPDSQIGLISFSGIAVIHAPPTRDHDAVRSMVTNILSHRYMNSGSHFGRAFEAVLHMVESRPGGNQVVLMSDGEALGGGVDFDNELALMEKNHVPVFTVGVGSRQGVSWSLYDPREVADRVQNPSIALTFFSSRDDAALKKIAKKTGGEYLNVEKKDWASDLAPMLQEEQARPVKVPGPGKEDLSFYFAALFLILFLVEALIIAGRRRSARTLGLLILLGPALAGTAGCSLWRAHSYNEEGIAHQKKGELAEARPEFEKSVTAGFRQEVPLYNLGNNYLRENDYSKSHEYYQKAMEARPDMKEAFFNDGHALYGWGRQELKGGAGKVQSPESAVDDEEAEKQQEEACAEKCSTERTEQLWKKAVERFERAAQLSAMDKGMKEQALRNAVFVTAQIEHLDRWFAACMRRCKEAGGKGGGGEDESQGGGGGGEDESQGGGGGQEPEQDEQDEKKEQKEKEEQKEKDQQQVEKELERIQQRVQEKKTFLQSGAQQVPFEEKEKQKLPAGLDLLW